MGTSQTTLRSEIENVVGSNRIGLIILSLVLILAGIAAIAFPHVSTLSVEFFIGWLLVFTGVCQILHSLQAKARGGFLWVLLIGGLETAIGVALLVFPLAGAFTLTVFLAMTFILEGFFRAAFSVQIRPMSGWGWVLISGALSIFIGGLLYAGLPSSALWAIGLMVGINVTMSGIALLMLAMAAGASKSIDTQQDVDPIAKVDEKIEPETETDKTSEVNEDKDTSVEVNAEKAPEVEPEIEKTSEQDNEKSAQAVVKADEEADPKPEMEAETEKTSKPDGDSDTQNDVDEAPVKAEDTPSEKGADTDTKAEGAPETKEDASKETKEEADAVKDEEKAPDKPPKTEA